MPSKRRIYKEFAKIGYTRVRNGLPGIALQKDEKERHYVIIIDFETKTLKKIERSKITYTFFTSAFEYEELKLTFELLKKEGWFNEKE